MSDEDTNSFGTNEFLFGQFLLRSKYRNSFEEEFSSYILDTTMYQFIQQIKINLNFQISWKFPSNVRDGKKFD